MSAQLIHDRGRGPEIVGTRITVYNLLPDFLDPETTEDDIARLYELKAEQVAAARAYVLNNADVVLDRHLQIEARIAAGNPPQVIEQSKRTRETFLKFKEWLARRREAEGQWSKDDGGGRDAAGPVPFPGFQDWLAQGQSRPTPGS